ncbi:3-oxoadipate enol-lactonase [Lentzea sp. NBC_00516]|uniref:3-oxoadipate enol-lactonase n=1 Tax=Lentzea sp. NBC_00516 TaxID=2903582 RepID=UPI002E80E774|nr:3-oxoadipate enol-lactonase [Lentzea sp. NBC_00516]WUD26903.1 3-oxoadipate enol-lactonase [Lentzea sp. NBC_00516]
MSVAEVHHVVTGRPDGPVVVLSNSLGSTLEMWDANVAALEEHFRVVRYDTRGHGRSPVVPGPHTIDALAGDLVVLLNRLDVEKAHLVGLSLGGMTALRVAARNPERVDRLAVLCTSACLGPAANWTDRAALVRARGTGAVAEAVVQRWFTPAYQDRARWEAMVSATPAEGYAGCCEAIAVMDQRADLAGISAPTLAIAGADDPATPPHHLEEIATSVQDGRLLVVPGAAHLANVEQPDVVTAALIDHLTKESRS